ncbi:hypothetical protein Tco_0510806 [Tanacetum coccineum]
MDANKVKRGRVMIYVRIVAFSISVNGESFGYLKGGREDKARCVCKMDINGTKLFTFDCTVLIMDESFIDVKEYSKRVFGNQDVTESENTASRISTASKNSTKESFVSKIPSKNIAEFLDVSHNTKMQASVRPGLVNQFKNRLEEGKAITLQ